MPLKRLIFITLLSITLLAFSSIQDVENFELEIEMKDNSSYEIEYEKYGDRYKAEYQVPGSLTIYGEEAKAMIEPLLNRLGVTPDIEKQRILEEISSIFKIKIDDIDDLKLEVEFSDGQKVAFKY